MVVPVYKLDLQLHVQPVPITNKLVISNSAHGDVDSMQHYVIKFVSDLYQVAGFHRILLGRRCGRMVIGFTTTCAIDAYHH